MRKTISSLFILGAVIAQAATALDSVQFQLEDSWEIDQVPSGFPVEFCILTDKTRQYIAYYNEQRQMCIASRSLDSDQWQYQVLPTRIGWDSHNYITMAVDGDGHLHVSGNMHCVKLIYFRTERPGDITSLKQLKMTGEQEDRVTYPKFLTDQEGTLLFNYRDGGSGNGMRIWNKYDLATRQWARLLDKPLLDGEGRCNAYPLGPIRGPDGWFHLVWVWRDTPDCATNHHLSYARSKDLVHWESAFGQKIEPSMTLDNKSLWVDPIPSGGGIINGCEKLTFDSSNRPIITYHKSDRNGDMQIYAARPEGTTWTRHVLTDWQQPIEFSGRGSMGFIGIRISGLSRAEPGLLTMTYRHRDYGSGRLVIDENSLRPTTKKIEVTQEYPKELRRKQSDFEGMGIRRAIDIGGAADDSVRYVLQWETLGANHDRPRKPPLPEPSTLRLYKLVANAKTDTANKAVQATTTSPEPGH
ncbi:BNR repeat-containing protein [Aeoliella sp. ICT_H6.2]|uniref:BNR repeat-containing protein n=1 Tax=Aeoliella straminimaris TaxID=2954799 RepID=A0A9X2JKI9_9BACT|nr:BNR repeat-containing protein [Aeoliella straminimaris]MCO6046649.1 BNR repeat-containing protein [Aeoliella straminimaris]